MSTNDWHVATLVRSLRIAKNVMSLTFSVERWREHKAGQYYDIRLTAEDGYQAVRSYSIASSPEEAGIVEFGIEKLEDGEVSPYLFDLQVGEQVEIRGPIGGHFIWDRDMQGPLYLIGGGSGMVPLMSMLRHRERYLEMEKEREVIFLASIRSLDYLLYYEELQRISQQDSAFKLILTFTRMAPPNWDGYRRRVDESMLTQVFPKHDNANWYVCGPTPFVEAVANAIVGMGTNPETVRTERFGG